MHTFEVNVGGQRFRVEATTWRRDLESGEVVFVVRQSLADGAIVEHEVSRHRIPDPHRHIRRL